MTYVDASDADLFTLMREGGDPHARDVLVERYLPLARRLARRYARAEEPLDDLVQVASLGLVKAVDRFDVSRKVVFSSFAVPTILGEIRRHFRDRTWSVRVPRDLQELALRVDRAVTQLSVGKSRSPSVGEIAEVVGATREQVLDAMEASAAYRAVSLDSPRAGGREEDGGEKVGDGVGVAEGGFELAEARVDLGPLLARLTARERLVLRLRFVEDLTQAQIGERIGVSQMQVSRVIRGALGRMRAGGEGEGRR
jgi:RNA polymerase sigma-B factor